MLAFCLLLTLLAPAPTQRSVQVLFIEPPGETFTAIRQAEALYDIAEAMEWWEATAPIETRLTLSATRSLTATEDVYTDLPIVSGDLTIVIIDNQRSGMEIQGYLLGGASYDLGMIWIVTTGNTAARIAHELGHAVYNLPDLYTTPILCTGIDLMCLSQRDAYQQRFLGCQSLAYLGHPCQRTYIAFIEE